VSLLPSVKQQAVRVSNSRLCGCRAAGCAGVEQQAVRVSNSRLCGCRTAGCAGVKQQAVRVSYHITTSPHHHITTSSHQISPFKKIRYFFLTFAPLKIKSKIYDEILI
jgi:hypothetical protein